jgi:hypothetical protein
MMTFRKLASSCLVAFAALAASHAVAAQTPAQTPPQTAPKPPAKPPAQKPAAKPAPSTPQKADPAETSERNLSAYVELLRADVRAQKVAIITEIMGFSEDEDKAFWPIYREYDTELAKINDGRVALIDEYAKNYDKVTDDLADKLATQALELESQRTALKTKYYQRFKSALSARTAARFLQVENQLLLLIDLQIAASLPIVQ